ncbi:MAG: carbon-nitrogen hydrolase family protein [Chloroflexi bacterium]|nr:carbon-nitrogen hydrolase family protein [Chloroflexota bacterium]
MADRFPTIRLAAAQATPVFLDRDATVRKACRIIEEAGDAGADVVGFPEGFLPAHPLWFHFHPATSPVAMALSKELFANAVTVPGPAVDALAAAARRADVHVVIGICEKDPGSMGTMYNSLLMLSRTGEIVGVRRKVVPTVGERIVHTGGSGDSVRVFETEFGAVSGLMCGENSNPLLTYSMQALGARVHVAAWPSFFNRSVDMWSIADIACRSIAYQNAAFVISAVSGVDDVMLERIPATAEDRTQMEDARTRGGSAIYAPGGLLLTGPAPGGDTLLVAEADLERIVPRKIVHDYAGDYNRFDIFQLVVNVSPGGPPIRMGSTGLNAIDAQRADGPVLPQLTVGAVPPLLLGSEMQAGSED